MECTIKLQLPGEAHVLPFIARLTETFADLSSRICDEHQIDADPRAVFLYADSVKPGTPENRTCPGGLLDPSEMVERRRDILAAVSGWVASARRFSLFFSLFLTRCWPTVAGDAASARRGDGRVRGGGEPGGAALSAPGQAEEKQGRRGR